MCEKVNTVKQAFEPAPLWTYTLHARLLTSDMLP